MSGPLPGPVTVPDIVRMKERGEKIVMLTAYDAPTARLLDSAGVDILLVGDSVGNVVLGYENTLPVTMDEMVHHARAVVRGASRCLVVADMPYLSYHLGTREAVRNAGRFLQEAGARAVKVEGGRKRIEVIRALRDRGDREIIASTDRSLVLLRGEFPDCRFVDLPDYNIRYSRTRAGRGAAGDPAGGGRDHPGQRYPPPISPDYLHHGKPRADAPGCMA